MNVFSPIAQLGPNPVPPPISAVAATSSPPATAVTATRIYGLVYPAGMSLLDWVDSFVHVNAHAIALPQFDGDFERWAALIVQELQPLTLPRPEDDWHAWAVKVTETMAPGAIL